jgi:hypothetical protein
MIPLGSGWLVAVHQVDVDGSLMAIARSSTEAAVAAGHLLGCDLGTHVLACGEPLAGLVTVVNGEVVMRIRSPEWRNTLRVQRPRSARLLFVRGGQEVLWEGLIDIDYDDRGHGV